MVEVTAGLEDCPLDVRAQLVEHWRAGVDGAHAQRGLSVFAYTYWVGCADPAIDLHYDLDPVRHPEMPLHWCKSQQLPSVRFGKSVRIPRLAYQRYLQRLERGRPKPLEHDSPGSQDQLKDFRNATGHDPETWIDEWRSGNIPDTPENTRLAIHALGLRDASRQRAKQTAALP